MHRKHDVQAFSKHRQKHRRAMFLSEHRLNIPSLRNGKHPIVKNIPSLRKVKIPSPISSSEKLLGRLYLLVWLQRRLILTMMCCVLLSTYVLPAKPNPIVCPNVRASILQF